MWRCKKCNGEVTYNKTIELLQNYRMNKYAKPHEYIYESELTEEFENYSCEDCMDFSCDLDEIAIWEEEN